MTLTESIKIVDAMLTKQWKELPTEARKAVDAVLEAAVLYRDLRES